LELIIILIFHQTGFRYQWNIQSYIKDKVGDGLIFSPLNIPLERVINIENKIKKNSYLDPQLYNPDIDENKKINTYNYFPCNIKHIYSNLSFDAINVESVKRCIDFQLENDFKYIIVPTIYFDSVVTDYFKKINEFIMPYIKYFKTTNIHKKLFLTLFIKQEQLTDDVKIIKLLNWATGINEVDGFYIIFENRFTTKQIKNLNYLVNTLRFIAALKYNNFEVHIGYNNNEGMLYSIAKPNSISIGIFENLRKFDISRFFPQKKKRIKRGPNPRIYSAKLFQWIENIYIDKIISKQSDIYEDIFENTKYKIEMFDPNYEWYFNKPETYMHYFIAFNNQLKNIIPLSQKERIDFLELNINNAKKIFDRIEDIGIKLDENSDGSHLDIWIKAIEKFKANARII
jgi:hypothetical protein